MAVRSDDRSDLWGPLAVRAVHASPTELDHIAQVLQELTYEVGGDELAAFEAAWRPVLPSLIERADRTDDVELAQALHHVADHLIEIDARPDVRLLLDHAWASLLWLRDELPEVDSSVLDFDEGERLHWYGDVGRNTFGGSVYVDAAGGETAIGWREAISACDEVCVTSTRVRFLAGYTELARLRLDDLEVVVIDDSTVLLRVGEHATPLVAALPRTLRAVVGRAREAAGHPAWDDPDAEHEGTA